MSNAKLFLLLPIAALVLLSARCRHCDPVAPVTLPFPDELKPYVDFGIGSYWVYEDSATGRLDSTVLTNKVWGWDYDYAKNGCDQIYVRKKVETLDLNYSFFQDGVYKNSYSEHRLYTLGWDTYDGNSLLVDDDDWFVIGYPLDGSRFYDNGYDISQTILDTVSVKGNIYSHPLKITSVPSSGMKYFLYNKYYKENIGCLKFTGLDTINPKDNYNLSLIRYKIL